MTKKKVLNGDLLNANTITNDFHKAATVIFELLYQTRTHHNAKNNHTKAMTYKTRILKDEKKFAYKRQTTINLAKEDH